MIKSLYYHPWMWVTQRGAQKPFSLIKLFLIYGRRNCCKFFMFCLIIKEWGEKLKQLRMTFLFWSSTDIPVYKSEWTLLLIVAISISLSWVSTSKHSRLGNGCGKKDSGKQLMSLPIIASVPIYRANKSKSLRMKHIGLLTRVCSQVTGHGNTLGW